jgi:hypothetical protein
MKLVWDFFSVDNGNIRILSVGLIDQRNGCFIVYFCHCYIDAQQRAFTRKFVGRSRMRSFHVLIGGRMTLSIDPGGM